MRSRFPAVIAVVVLSVACNNTPVDLVCTDIFRPAVAATIADSVTGLSATYTSSLILQNASVYDSAYFAEQLGIIPSTDSAPPQMVTSRVQLGGVYAVRVRRTGYLPWVRSGITVPSERCGPITVHLDIRLQRSP